MTDKPVPKCSKCGCIYFVYWVEGGGIWSEWLLMSALDPYKGQKPRCKQCDVDLIEYPPIES